MNAIRIRRFTPADTAAVIGVILSIQQEEFGLAITAEDQPDLQRIAAFYQQGKGDFLVAEADGLIVGTIGMKDIDSGRVALRKMFVAAPWRGRPHRLAQGLLDRLIDMARERAVTEIWLGTTDAFLAAHRFYERNGFARTAPESLPAGFPRMAVDTRFYRRALP